MYAASALSVFLRAWVNWVWSKGTKVHYWNTKWLWISKRTKTAKLWTAVPDGSPVSLCCLIPSLSLSLWASSPGCYCWCPTNSAPAHSGGGRQELGVPFYLTPHLSCWGCTNWKAVVTALTPQAVAPPGGRMRLCFGATGLLQHQSLFIHVA